MFEAIIFDFDGVILDSEPFHYEACCHILASQQIGFTFQEYMEKYLGLSDKEMFTQLLINKGYSYSPAQINTMIENKIEHYINLINTREKLPIINGIQQYLLNIAEMDKKIAICTNATQKEVSVALARINQGSLQALFDTIVTIEDVKQGKPSPQGYLLTARRLGILPAKCMVIEDSPYGIEAARMAGMFVVALLTTHDREQLSQAHKIVMNFNELSEEEVIS